MCKRMKLRTSYDTKEPSTLYSNGGEGARWGLGGGGVTPASRTLQSRIPPPLFLTLSLFFITKYWPLLRNFPHFSLFSCRSLLSRLPYPSRPFLPRTSTNTWMDCGLSIVSLAEGRGGGGGRVGKVVRGSKPPAPHTLPSWLPSLLPWFLTPRAFAIAKYWALYCCVISPISLASIHNKEFLPPVLPSLTSLSTFLLDSHNPLLSHYKWFNTKLLVGLCCSFTIIQKKKNYNNKVNWDRVFTGDVWRNKRTIVSKWHRNRWCVNSRWKLSR